MKAPIRIGFLAAQFDEPYQNAVWTGAVEEAGASGISLVFYASEAPEMTTFDLAEKNELSGLIVMTNSMGPTLSQARIAEYLARFTRLPLISIGIDFPGIPSICTVNSGCIGTLTEHLVNVHGRERFLFLAGSEGHQEGMLREKEFREAHAKLLPWRTAPRAIPCDFTEEVAYSRVRKLIADGWDYDAVMAANDQMAMGAIRALEEHGINVPTDVSVTGFDNIEDSFYSIPPLTTVQQPMAELGARAVRYLAARLNLVSKAPDLSNLRSTCVIRNSCGCKIRHNADMYVPIPGGHRKRTREQQMEHRLRYQLSQRVAVEARFGIIRRFESSLTVALTMEDLLTAIGTGITAQGIGFCALVLFDSTNGAMDWAKLMLVANESGIRILTPYGLRFRTMEVLPGGLPDELVTFVCEPLQFANEALGYLVCSTDAPDRHLYAVLRDQVSAAMKRALLLEEERNREKALELEVRRRTSELSLTNRRLKEEITQRTRLERELLDISNNIMTRIGQDIHDDLCQDIAGISVLGATLVGSLRRIEPQQVPLIELAAKITGTASQTAKHAKQIARELYPAEFESNGIISALTQLVNAKRAEGGPEIELDIQDGFFIHSSEKALQLYRIIQEAFSNAIKHSQGTRIKIGLYMSHEMIDIEVSDNGRGMPSRTAKTETRAAGMGLKILKYRANVINGKLKIKSDEHGTIVTCRVAR